jgi:hypothetical protein
MTAMSRTWRAVLAMTCAMPWAAGACSDGTPGNDGPAVTITVTTGSAPALIAFRDGEDAAWQVPTAAAVGRYELAVRGPYTVEVVCSAADFTEILEIARTPDDPRELAMTCRQPSATPARLHVTGTMTQAAQLALGTAQSVTVGDELQFDLEVEPGTFDLVVKTIAAPGEDEVVIRRDQVITASTRVSPAIDPAREKVALVEVPVTVTNTMADDTTSVVSARLTTSSTASALATGRDASTVRVLASSVLRPTDQQTVRAVGSRVITGGPYQVRFRTVEHRLGTGPLPVLALPIALDSLQFTVVDEQQVVTWGALPEYGELELSLEVAPRIIHRKALSLGYVKATGATSATLDADVPGFQPAWKIDLTAKYGRQFVARQTNADATGSISLLDEDINVPPGM